MLKFVYKGKEYTFKEWRDDYNNFVESLELPNDFLELENFRGNIAIHDFGYEVAISKILELYKMIASARAALMTAYQKTYDSNIISFDNDYESHLWMRAEYLKNSIVWYNSCEDYVYQILWFAFELHKIPLSNKEEYAEALSNCTHKNVKKELKKVDKEDAKKLLDLMENYRYDDDVKYLRETLANNLKHRANLDFAGIYRSSGIGVQFKDRDGNITRSTDFIKPEVVDIDDTIELVKKVHKKLINFSRDVIKFMNIDEVFEKDEEGRYKLNLIRDKSKYKRVIIN